VCSKITLNGTSTLKANFLCNLFDAFCLWDLFCFVCVSRSAWGCLFKFFSAALSSQCAALSSQCAALLSQCVKVNIGTCIRVRTQSGIVWKCREFSNVISRRLIMSGIWTKLWKCLEMSGILTQWLVKGEMRTLFYLTNDALSCE
jgi:hypothetical protein